MKEKPTMGDLLEQTAALHRHLCPRQVLGVRMGMLAGELLGVDLPQSDKRVFAFMETDGCTCDGVAIASGARVGRRTMRMMDFGKVAATFVDTFTGAAVRIWPHPASRLRAVAAAPDAPDRWHAQLLGYQRLSAEDILVAAPVDLTVDLAKGSIEYHATNHEPWRVTLVDTGEETMTGGRLKRVAPYLPKDEPFFLTYGDGVADLDLRALADFHRSHGKDATVTAVIPPRRLFSDPSTPPRNSSGVSTATRISGSSRQGIPSFTAVRSACAAAIATSAGSLSSLPRTAVSVTATSVSG